VSSIDMPAGEVLARAFDVQLTWGDRSHYDPAEKLPCRHGDGPTVMRDDAGNPCHIRCAEKELAAAIAAERFGDLSPHGLTQELTGHPAEVRR
jgi:hypothetical protein